MIVDAGGGTIDVTTYRRTSRVAFEEVVIPQCMSTMLDLHNRESMALTLTPVGYFQGAVYVARRAKRHFEGEIRPCSVHLSTH